MEQVHLKALDSELNDDLLSTFTVSGTVPNTDIFLIQLNLIRSQKHCFLFFVN